MNSLEEPMLRLAELAGFVWWNHAADLSAYFFISPGYEAIWGRTRESLYEQPAQWREGVLAEDETSFSSLCRPSANAGSLQHAIFRVRRPDGTLRWIEAWSFSPDGERIWGFGRDITETREHQLEREADHEQIRLSLEARSRYLATISHEIRTPLSSILGMTGLLRDTGLETAQQEMTETILRSGEQMLNLINEVLDLSKIEAGQMTLEIRDFNLQETVDNAVELLAKRAQAKGVSLLGLVEMNVPSDLRGDASRLVQILTNLLDNAVKFTDRGEILLRVSRRDQGNSAVDLLFEVKDSGVGLSPETSRHIFQPFRQATVSTANEYGGTGLGLAIVREFVTLMGGEVGVESEPGRGSLFWFTARFAQSATPPLHRRDAVLVGLRVLMAVENPLRSQVLRSKLLGLGIYPATASTPDEVVTTLARASQEDIPFDLCLLDWRLGELENWALPRRIKDSSRVPVILLNARGAASQAADFADRGIEDVLNEPIRQDRLAERLAAVMASLRGDTRGSLDKPTPISVEADQTRILVAEDNPVNRKIVLLQLERLGYRADAVADGTEVLEVLKTAAYDIILMDCLMPKLDGYETTGRIRREYGRTIRIIALTAHALPTDRDKCLAAGMDDYLTKPALIADLKSVIERWRPAAK